MGEHEPAQAPLCACSSLSTAFMRFKQDNASMRAEVAELKGRTLPRPRNMSSLSEESFTSSQLSPTAIENKLDRLTTLLECVALDMKAQREVFQPSAGSRPPSLHGLGVWRCPSCAMRFRVDEEGTTLRPSREQESCPTENPAAVVHEEETEEERDGDGEGSGAEHEETAEAVVPEEREETESASAEPTAAAAENQDQVAARDERIRELELKTSELLRMNYTWQEYFQVVTARMDDERFLWRLQLGELDRNVDSGPLLAQLHERVGVMERERLEGLEKMNALTASLRSAEERVRCLQDETERLQAAAVAEPVPEPEPEPCGECERLSVEISELRERCAWLLERSDDAEQRCLRGAEEHAELIGRVDAIFAEAEGLREQLVEAQATAEKATRKVAQMQAECESLRLAQATMEARREGDTSPTQLSQLGHMQTISAWNCPSCNCKNPPFTPMCHKCHRGQRPPPFNPYVLDRS